MSFLFYGLTNGGSTCWLNAIYQSLISLDPLIDILSRKENANNPARLIFANYIGDRLIAKFFGQSQATTNAQSDITIMNSAPAPMRELFIRLVSAIDALSDPESFYASHTLRDLFTAKDPNYFPFPLATSALINYSRYQSESALRLFGALVIYCAATEARPVPEYHSIGEISSAMLETIIGALCWEHTADSAAEKEIRAVFSIHSRTQCLCFDHAPALADHITKKECGAKQEHICIQAVPPSRANSSVSSFVSSVQVQVDICERCCTHCDQNQECGIPGILNVEYHESFGPVIIIMTDDSVARGLTRSSVTSIYRRYSSGDNSLCIPREMILMNHRAHKSTLAKYRLVAQIIQEGGHFTACVARRIVSAAAHTQQNKTWTYAYANDKSITTLSDMPASSGICALFYVRVQESTFDNDDNDQNHFLERAIYDSMRGYIALNSNINVASVNRRSFAGSLEPLQSIACAGAFAPKSAQALFRDFYFAAMNIHITLLLRTTLAPSGLEILWANKIGAHHGSLIAQAVLQVKQTNHKFEPDVDFAIWRFCIDPVMRAILRTDESDKLRAEIDRRMSTRVGILAGPLVGLAAHSCIAGHSRRDIIIERISAYLPRMPVRAQAPARAESDNTQPARMVGMFPRSNK